MFLMLGSISEAGAGLMAFGFTPAMLPHGAGGSGIEGGGGSAIAVESSCIAV